MAIKELFQDSRPQVLLDPRASQRIDSRFKFTRNGVATYYDKDGVLRYAPANQPRVGFNYEPDENGVMQPVQGLVLEQSSTNYLKYSSYLNTSPWTNQFGDTVSITTDGTVAPDGTTASKIVEGSANALQRWYQATGVSDAPATGFSGFIYAKAAGRTLFELNIGFGGTSIAGRFNLADGTSTYTGNSAYASATTVSMIPIGNSGWYKCGLSTTADLGSLNFLILLNDSTGASTYQGNGASGIYAFGAQLELSPLSTSYIPTTSATVTREPDLLSIEGTSLPSTGSIYIDARSLSSDVDDTLLSAANASDDKLTLAIREPANLYNSKALVYEVDGAFKPTLPFPVPTDARERNLITYGANNYHYRSDSSRLTPSSSSSVPANMTRLGIGHDVTDPTKAFNGYINTVYLWPGEITPTVAEALVRGDLDPKDADAGVFTPETGALAFVFNTQGTATDGDRVVELPVSGSTNNILVDWGDNTSSSFIGAAADSTVSHTYPSAGIYPVQITADDDGTNSGLENLQFYNNSPDDLVRVLQWGGTTTWQPTTMYRAFRDCTQLDFENAARTNLPDTSAITNWQEAFYNCSSLSGAYPNFNHSAATTLRSTWYNCSSITTFGSSLNDLAVATNYSEAWRGCSSITSFPSIKIPTDKGAVNFARAWQSCSNLDSFPPNDSNFDTSEVTDVSNAWAGCSSLLGTFPTLNTGKVTNFSGAWQGCSSLTNFPNIITSEGTNFYRAWDGCSSLTSFGPTNFSKATTLEAAFKNWTDFIGAFPSITTSTQLTNLAYAWQSNKMTTFNLPTDTSEVTNFQFAWTGCTGLTTFPEELDTSKGENFYSAWSGCSNLDNVTNAGKATSFPLINTSAGTNFQSAWQGCSKLTIFPPIITSAGANFVNTWNGCTSLTSFPSIDISGGTSFFQAWLNCSSLTSFPANFFDTWTGAPSNQCFYGSWDGCSSLTPASVVNILNSIAASGQSAPSGTGTNDKKITIDWDGTGDPAADADAAISTLKSRAWDVVLNGVLQ